MLKDLAGLSKSEDPALVGKIKEQGQTLHSLMEAINDYLAELFSAGVLTELQATQTAKLMHVCGDVERMGELADGSVLWFRNNGGIITFTPAGEGYLAWGCHAGIGTGRTGRTGEADPSSGKRHGSGYQHAESPHGSGEQRKVQSKIIGTVHQTAPLCGPYGKQLCESCRYGHGTHELWIFSGYGG